MDLGVTEQLVVDKFENAVDNCISGCRNLLVALEELTDVDWASLIQDSTKKESIVKCLEPLEHLNNGLAMNMLIPTIITALSESKVEE